MNIKTRLTLIVAWLATTYLLAISTIAYTAELKMEKCTGIVKAGKADGESMVDGKMTEWILVPEGQCMKLIDGKVIIDNK